MPPRPPSNDPNVDPVEGPGVIAAMLQYWKISGAIIAGSLLLALLLLTTQARVIVASTRVSFLDPQAVPFPRSNTRLQDDLNRYLSRVADTAASDRVVVDAADRIGGDPEKIDRGLTVTVVAPAAALDLKLAAADREAAETQLAAVVEALQTEMERANRDATARTLASIDDEIARVDEDIDVGRVELANDPGSIASQQVLTSNLTLRASLIEKRNELDTNASALGSGVARVEQVTVRVGRSGPGTVLGIALATSIGVLAAAVVSWVLATRRPRIQAVADPERLLDVPLLATVPNLRRREPGALRSPPSPPAEASAILVSALRPWRSNVVVVTGAGPGDGATTVAVNLAVSLALGGRRVALVDADLRRGDLTRRLGYVGRPGLGDVGAEAANGSGSGHVLPTYDCQVGRNGASFQFVPSGTVDSDLSGRMLWAPTMAHCIAELASTFDAVIVDTPPVEQHPDAVAMVDVATKYVLVIRRGALMASVTSAGSVLSASGVDLAGYVLTRVGRGGSPSISSWADQREQPDHAEGTEGTRRAEAPAKAGGSGKAQGSGEAEGPGKARNGGRPGDAAKAGKVANRAGARPAKLREPVAGDRGRQRGRG